MCRLTKPFVGAKGFDNLVVKGLVDLWVKLIVPFSFRLLRAVGIKSSIAFLSAYIFTLQLLKSGVRSVRTLL
ncbi:hypothetical protein SDC9_148082 [bioreactor metagenome]|uniref:Uncharacterized protein n=1 Tax=bioreactor metagenome TaxID=1076179 RepID=A0A645EJJ1_9ZZZZ